MQWMKQHIRRGTNPNDRRVSYRYPNSFVIQIWTQTHLDHPTGHHGQAVLQHEHAREVFRDHLIQTHFLLIEIFSTDLLTSDGQMELIR